MKILTINNIIRWCLALLCFGLVGIKITNAQNIGSGGCNFGYTSAIMSLTIGSNLGWGEIFELNASGVPQDNWGSHFNGTPTGYSISRTFSRIDINDTYLPISLDDTASATNFLEWGIFHYDNNTAPSGFTYTIDSVTVAGHAIGGGTLSFDLFIGGVQITNGAALGSTFSGYLDYGNDAYSNNNLIQLRPYDNGTNVMEFKIDSINVAITAFANGGTNTYDLCTGVLTPVPETSASLLAGLSVLVLAIRRRRA